MHITCFLVPMILSQIIVSLTEAKPFFTKIHRLNTVRDFDDIVDWTVGEKPIRSAHNGEQKKTTTSTIKEERSITSGTTEVTSTTDVTLSLLVDTTTISSELDETAFLESISEKRSDASTSSKVDDIIASEFISDNTSEDTTCISFEDATINEATGGRAEKDISAATTTDTVTTESTSHLTTITQMTKPAEKNKRSEISDVKEDVVDEYSDDTGDFEDDLKRLYRKMKERSKRRKFIEEPEQLYYPDSETKVGFTGELKKFYRNFMNKMNGKKSEEDQDDIGYGDTYAQDVRKVCNRVRGKIKEKKVKKAILPQDVSLGEMDAGSPSKVHYIFPYRRSIPNCLLNERFAGDHYPTDNSDKPIIQPILIKDSSTYIAQPIDYDDEYDDDAALYEVKWLSGSQKLLPIVRERLATENLSRKRREADYSEEETYSVLVDRNCPEEEKLSKSQEELMEMIRSLKREFLSKNNLSFLPLLFVPSFTSDSSYSLPCSTGLGDVAFHNIEPRSGKFIPTCGRIIKLPKMKIHHVVIVLMTNNSLNFLLPLDFGNVNTSDSPIRTILFKRNVISNLKQYLQNAFNFIDIRKVLTEDDSFSRKKRSYEGKSRKEVIPGVLLYPSYFGSFFPDEPTNYKSTPDNPLEYYYFTTKLNENVMCRSTIDESEVVTQGEDTSVTVNSNDVPVTTIETLVQ